MALVIGELTGKGLLDYVTAWYFKAAQYIAGTNIQVAFVSTNSVSQGEQVGILWGELFRRYQLKIIFAYRTFSWKSEARGRAHVHVVIVGFANHDVAGKAIYESNAADDTVTRTLVTNISPYLVQGSDTVVTSRTRPIPPAPSLPSVAELRGTRRRTGLEPGYRVGHANPTHNSMRLNILPTSPTGSIFCPDFRLSPPVFSIFYEEGGRGRGYS